MECTLIWQTARLSRRTVLHRLGAAGMFMVFRPAGAWATQEPVQQAIRQRIGAREPQSGGVPYACPKSLRRGTRCG